MDRHYRCFTSPSVAPLEDLEEKTPAHGPSLKINLFTETFSETKKLIFRH